MKETNLIKIKSCAKCRHYERFRGGMSRGLCGAYVAVPFWMMIIGGSNSNNVSDTDGKDCNLFNEIPNGVDSHVDNGNQRQPKEE